jgi:hypothetical protein
VQGRVLHQLADPLGQRDAAWLAQEHGAERLGEPRGDRGLAAPSIPSSEMSIRPRTLTTRADVGVCGLSLARPIPAAPRRRGSPPDADRPSYEGARHANARPIDPDGAHDAEASTVIGRARL